ncbi:ABC multidrug transporter [Diplogelasinospora grovesii]|uniref:ABC multidrug transporter n=1 Tax=Diplogelasinospora grovesii TaxID=303347 RepID=A0AAN6N048_9PEZI|nr:ABC multidrug transporter [Diplogelasinospora grovesii]
MRSIPYACPPGGDNTFGPWVAPSCRDGREDFTLFFEDVTFAILPSAIFISAALVRSFVLVKQSKKTTRRASVTVLRFTKILFWTLQWTSPANKPGNLSLFASVLALASSAIFAVLSFLEHDRSISPSSTIIVFLLISTLCDIPILRTLWLRQDDQSLPLARATALPLKMVILVIESKSKRNYLQAPYRDSSPEVLEGIVSRALFWWLTPILRRGYYTTLELAHLPPLDPKLGVARLQTRFGQAWKQHSNGNKHALMYAAFSCYRRQFLSVIPLRLFSITCKFCQPLLIDAAVTSMSKSGADGSDTRTTGVLLTGAAAITYVGIALATAAYKHQIYRTMIAFRSGLIAVIHDASLALNASDAKDAAAVTLMSTDVDRIIAGIEMLDVVWATPIEVTVAILMLGRQLGWAAVSPLIIAMSCALGSVYIGKLATKYQKTWIDSIQERVAATAQILNNIKSVKMMGMTPVLAEGLQKQRLAEIRKSRSYRKVDTAQQALGNTTLVVTPVVTFLLYYYLSHRRGGENLDPARAFTSLSLITLLSYPIVYFVFAVPRFTGSIGCYTRIQDYLLSPGAETQKLMSRDNEDGEFESAQKISDGDDSEEVEMESLLPKVIPMKRAAASDWVEIPITKLSSTGEDSVFVEDGTLITIEDADFSFPNSTDTALRHISLTVRRGQQLLVTGPVGSGKSTLLLAILGELNVMHGRAFCKSALGIAFCAQEPWLPNVSIQDAIVAASDSSLDQTWFKQVVAACDLVKDISRLLDKEHTMVGSNGASLSGGQKQRLSLARALYARKELLLLDDVLSGLDASTSRVVVQNVLGPNGLCRKHGVSVIMTASTVRFAELFDATFVLGNITQTHPMSQVQRRAYQRKSCRRLETASTAGGLDAGLSLYKYYFATMGWGSTGLVLVSSATFVFCFKFPDVWLKWWTEYETRDPTGSQTKMYIAVYLALAVVAFVALVSFSWSLKIIAVPRAAANLHQTLLSTVVSAPYCFLLAAGSGSIVNRFSEDLSIIDLQLTLALAKSIDGFFTVVAEAALVASASPLTVLSFPPLIAVIYLLQKVYLRSSRRIRVLEIEARAPLYTHFLETLAGLTTIRAFAWQRHWEDRQRDALDRSQRALYMTYCTQRWLNLVLDLVVAGVGTTVMALGTQIPSDSNGGVLGVSLANIVTFSATLTYVIQGWAQLETSMGAVQRVRDFTEHTPSENKTNEDRDPPAGWTSRAASVKFDDVTAAYSQSSSPVLKGVTFKILPGHKVGICGRTGSGKSTLLLTLLRLTEVLGGHMEIGGLDILPFHRDGVRKSMTVIPQDPLIFPGTVRHNLDPNGRHSDAKIRKALKRVGLDGIVGINIDMQSNASLSRGELQLFCLARALLQQSALVVMDEATSSVDAETEETIMQIVTEDFAKSTVIAVAHRLKTIRKFDLVLVVDQGRLVEAGRPEELLKKHDSMFAGLYRQSG